MTTPTKNTSCKLGCWALSLAITLITTVGCLLLGEMMIKGALFLGIVVFFVLRAMLGWILCRPLPPLGRPVKGARATESTGSSAKAASAQAAETISALARSGLKSSISLACEAELASRNGKLRYERSITVVGGSAPGKAAPKKVAPNKAAKSPALQKEVVTGPEKLEGPRGGVADDLMWIKEIGANLEQLCHSLGFFYFDQFANWSDDEVAWVDANLERFKGRVTRDQWVAQTKELAKG